MLPASFFDRFYLRSVALVLLLFSSAVLSKSYSVVPFGSGSNAANKFIEHLKYIDESALLNWPGHDAVIATDATPSVLLFFGLDALAAADKSMIDFQGGHLCLVVYAKKRMHHKVDSNIISRCYLLYTTPPLQRQIQLANLLLPRAKRIALLVSNEENLQDVKAVLGDKYTLNSAVVKNTRETLKELPMLLAKSDYLLGIDDSVVYNASSIKSILMMSYRNNKVLIGPSSGYVKVGGVASTYSSITQVAESSYEIMKLFASNQLEDDSSYVSEFSVKINRQVAKSLNISVEEDHVIEKKLRDKMGELQ